MKNFGQTTGADVDTTEFQEETHWMTVKEAVGQTLIVRKAHTGKTQWGTKYFITVNIENDEEAVDYTISASDNSALYHQIEMIVLNDGNKGFPFRATVRQVGRTYEFADAPERKAPSRAPVGRQVSEESPY